MLNLLTSQLFLTCLFAWFLAEVLKILISRYVLKTKVKRRFIDSGGFPSGHTTLVTTLFFMVGFETNWDVVISTIVGILAVVVMYDATNIRFNAGLHAVAINKLNEQGKFLDKKLKENLGHTYFEVLGGFILGVIVSLLSSSLF